MNHISGTISSPIGASADSRGGETAHQRSRPSLRHSTTVTKTRSDQTVDRYTSTIRLRYHLLGGGSSYYHQSNRCRLCPAFIPYAVELRSLRVAGATEGVRPAAVPSFTGRTLRPFRDRQCFSVSSRATAGAGLRGICTRL